METFHGLIEDEFYDIEDYRNGGNLSGGFEPMVQLEEEEQVERQQASLEMFLEVSPGNIFPPGFQSSPHNPWCLLKEISDFGNLVESSADTLKKIA